ncbi:MAG: mannose-1-phosphate guanylyltransferase [Puniceicoccaceae bacterium]
MDTKPRERFIVIMAGGKGERFWPQSRNARPKHLLPILGSQPMLTQTIERFGSIVPRSNILIITNREQVSGVQHCLPQLPPANIIAEPIGRDTAAAVGLATLLVKSRNPEAVFAMLPADHLITDHANFQACLERAFTVASKATVICTIGIRPEFPATGYGYIERGQPLPSDPEHAFQVKRFVEKPDLPTATAYLEKGGFFWNAGMFFWSVPTIDQAIRRYLPDLATTLDQIGTSLNDGGDFQSTLEALYPQLEKISIDYAVMQKADNVAMIESTFDWDDLGSWPALARHLPPDPEGNHTEGKAVLQTSKNNLVINHTDRALVLVGVEDLIVVETEDATLVCRREEAEKIKAAVKTMGSLPAWQQHL